MAKKPEVWAVWNAHKAKWIGRSTLVTKMSEAKTFASAEEATEECAGSDVPVRISE